MSVILYHNGAYNLYSRIAGGACYTKALTLSELEEVIEIQYGKEGLRELPERLERAHKTGCSSLVSDDLEEMIEFNNAGPNGERISVGEFIAEYLTLPPGRRGGNG